MFTGKELDEETQLYYFGARYYDPRTSVWQSADPLLGRYFAGDLNRGVHTPPNLSLYAYAWNNPLALFDPSGSSVSEPGFWEGLVPVWGSGREAVHHFQEGNWVRGTAYTALAVSDVFLVKALVVAGGKLVVQGGVKLAIRETGETVLKETGETVLKEAGETAAKETGETVAKQTGETAARETGETATRETAERCAGGTCGGPGVCFVAGTLVATERGGVPIEQLQLGDRVEAGNNRCQDEHIESDAQTISLEIPNPAQPQDIVHVELVRQRSWLTEQGLSSGQTWLELPEVGVSGWARIVGIGPAPKEKSGRGCLVLMRVSHVASQVLKVRLSGAEEVIEVTPPHPLYVEGHGWMSAGAVQPGMKLRSDSGPVSVEAIEQASPNQYVYNIEVGLEHTYRVSNAHIWAHNQCAFGGLSRAAEFGIKPYGQLARALEKSGLQAHHLIEKRFAGVMGQDVEKMLSVAVTPAEHQAFTNAWRKAIPYGKGTANATAKQVVDTARQIYSGRPEILKALGL
jgi:RHS repeat-associated protein